MRLFQPLLQILSLCLGLCGFALADTPLDHAEKSYATNRARFFGQPTNAVAAWQFGQACFDRAEFARDDSEREALAQEGISACRHGIKITPSSGPAHYFLALNLGQLARTRTFGALKLVREMEREFERSIQFDEKIDFAGPHRSLGRLYLEAPGWPTSIGSRNKARHHLEKAAELVPEYPENHLLLLEAYLKWGENKNIERELGIVPAMLAKARTLFDSPDWTDEWLDWEQRWERMQNKAEKERLLVPRRRPAGDK